MCHGRLSRAWWLAAFLFAVGSVLPGSAQIGTGRPGRALQFGQPQSPNFTNSIGHLGEKGEEENTLGDNLLFNRDLQEATAPHRSMDVILPPMQTIRSPAAIKRARELIERKRDWLSNPETLANTLTPDKDSKSDQGNGQELSPLEEYYRKMVGKQNASATENNPGARKTDAKENDDRNLPPDLKERTRELRTLLGEDPSAGKEKELGNGLEPFGKNSGLTFSSFEPSPLPAREELDARKARMSEFRQMSGMPASALTPVEAFKQLGTPSDPVHSTFNSGLGPATQLPALQESPVAQFGSLPSLAALPEATRALASPTLAPTMARPEPPAVKLAPPAPNFTAPKRPF